MSRTRRQIQGTLAKGLARNQWAAWARRRPCPSRFTWSKLRDGRKAWGFCCSGEGCGRAGPPPLGPWVRLGTARNPSCSFQQWNGRRAGQARAGVRPGSCRRRRGSTLAEAPPLERGRRAGLSLFPLLMPRCLPCCSRRGAKLRSSDVTASSTGRAPQARLLRKHGPCTGRLGEAGRSRCHPLAGPAPHCLGLGITCRKPLPSAAHVRASALPACCPPACQQARPASCWRIA